MGIVTLISKSAALGPETVAKFETVIPNVQKTRVLSERAIEVHFDGSKQSLGAAQWAALKQSLYDTKIEPSKAQIPQVDPILLDCPLKPGLVVFDMDSTLIQQEVIDVIASYAGLESEVSKITEAAMRGELDFNASLEQRVALLKGIDASVFEDLKHKVTFTPGVRELTKGLKRLGVKMAVLSGGFVPLARWVQNELGLDYMYANNLQVSDDEKLTGKTYGRIINGQAKAEILAEIAAKEHVDLSNVIAVGDGSNDLPMMGVAGFGIAFNAKPIVQQKAPSRINTGCLKDVLYILGYTDHEQSELVN